MNNYDFCNPTRIIFGRDTQKKCGKIIKEYTDGKVLFHYGSGSIKRSGLYDQVIASLKEAGVDYVELGGVEANPRLTKVYEGIRICREQDIKMVFAVGGGSVIDSAKAIAAGAVYEGDVWDFYEFKAVPEKTLLVGDILTLPATGTESSINSVLSRLDTNQNVGIAAECLRPTFSILNPELYATIPKKVMAPGIFDMFMHTVERYLTNTDHVDFTDGLCESVMKTIMRNSLKLMEDITDYNAWTQVVNAGTLAHNNYLAQGRSGDWNSHNIAHQLGGVYDATHGEALSILAPAYMKYVYKKHLPMFVQFATNVMGVGGSLREPEEIAYDGILALENYIRRMDLPLKLSDIGVNDDSKFEYMAKRQTEHGPLVGIETLYWQDIVEIFKLAR